jgi:hypothetical protein
MTKQYKIYLQALIVIASCHQSVSLQGTVLRYLLLFGTLLLKKTFSVAGSTSGCEAAVVVPDSMQKVRKHGRHAQL